MSSAACLSIFLNTVIVMFILPMALTYIFFNVIFFGGGVGSIAPDGKPYTV